MKSTGIVRPLDQLGRVVLPKELRNVLNLNEGDGLEVFVDGETIILRKYQPDCIFCGGMEDIRQFLGKNICKNCRNELKKRGVDK